MSENFHFKIAVVGRWHLAMTTVAGLASIGHQPAIVNPSLDPKESWSQFPQLDFNEPGLNTKLLEFHQKGQISYTSNLGDEWEADYVICAVDTPLDEFDNSNIQPIKEIISFIAHKKKIKKALIICSQVPLGFCQQIEKKHQIPTAYVPENLRLGKGYDTFLRPDRIVIGASDKLLQTKIKEGLAKIKTNFYLCDLPTAEMIKHATNTFLATSISLANELAQIGEPFKVDNQLVGKALRSDSRIGKKAYVIPGDGFSGGTLARDLKALQKLGRENGLTTSLIDSVILVNDSINQALARFLKQYFKKLTSKNILLIGYSYKPDIDTTRRSPVLSLAKILKQYGVHLIGYDPLMNDKDLSKICTLLNHYPSWEEIDVLPDAIILITPRPQFQNLDWKKVKKETKDGDLPLIVDMTSNLNQDKIIAQGFAYKALWQPLISITEKE